MILKAAISINSSNRANRAIERQDDEQYLRTVIKDTSGSNNTLARAPCRCSGHRDSNTLLERIDCLIGKDVHGYPWISMPLYPSLSTCKGPHLQSNPTTPLITTSRCGR